MRGYMYHASHSPQVGIEDVVAASGDGVRFASIYLFKDKAYVQHAVRQISSLGFSAIIITCDHPHDRVKNSSVPYCDASGW